MFRQVGCPPQLRSLKTRRRLRAASTAKDKDGEGCSHRVLVQTKAWDTPVQKEGHAVVQYIIKCEGGPFHSPASPPVPMGVRLGVHLHSYKLKANCFMRFS